MQQQIFINAIKSRTLWIESNVLIAIRNDSNCEENRRFKDTVIDFERWKWYLHDQSSVGDICYSIQRAIQLYEDKVSLNKIRNRNAQTIPGKEFVKNI
jgi:hypothetical protein